MPYTPPIERETTYGDYIDLFRGGLWGAASSAAGLLRSVEDPNAPASATLQQFQNYLADKRDAQTGEMTPEMAARVQSEVGSEEFWKSPTGWAAAQLVGSSPYILATVVPVALTGGLLGVAEGAVAGGALTAGDVVSQAQETVDNMSDDELAEVSLGFADDILNGVSSSQARQNLIDTMNDNKGAIAFALGVGSNMLGLGRIAGGAIGRVTGRTPSAFLRQPSGGFIKGATKEGVAGAGTEYAEEFGTSVLQQEAQVKGGFQEAVDIGRAHAAGMTGLVVGGALGGIGGAIERAGKSEARQAIPSTAPPPASVVAATEPAAQPPSPPVGGTTPPTPPAGGTPPPTSAPATAPPKTTATTAPAAAPAIAAPTAGAIPVTSTSNLPAVRGTTEPTVLGDPITPSPDVQLAVSAKTLPAPPTMRALPPPDRSMAPVPPQQPIPPPAAVPPTAPVPPTNVPPAQPVPPSNVPPMRPVPPPAGRPMQPVPPPNRQAMGAIPASRAPGMQPTPVNEQIPFTYVPPSQARPMQPVPPPRAAPTPVPMRPMPGREVALAPSRQTQIRPTRPLPETPPVIEMQPSPYEGGRIRLPPPPSTTALRPPPRVIALPRGPQKLYTVWDKELGRYRQVKESELEATREKLEAEALREEREEVKARKEAPLSPEELETLHKEGIRTGKVGKKAIEKRVEDEAKAKELFSKYAKGARDPQETMGELRERVSNILADVSKADIKIPDRVRLTTDEMAWLKEIKDLDRTFKTKGKVSPDHMQEFAFRERALKEGESEILREGRKLGGALKAEAGGKQKAPPTKFEKAKAGEGKQIEITPELRAKYETPPKAAKVVAKAKEKAPAKKELPPKVTTLVQKAKTSKQRLATAAKRVDKQATQAQLEAGNARTGPFSWHGLDIAIQYTKGMIRRGVSATQEAWETVMPAHYGHIKGTKGADGSPIDVYIGSNPDANLVFVLDQVDPDTHEFDEHKVMIGFKDSLDALNTYTQAFPDGSGPARVGDVTVMTVPEFKAWLADKTITDPAGAPEVPPEATSSAIEGWENIEPGPEQKLIDPIEAINKWNLKGDRFANIVPNLRAMMNELGAPPVMRTIYPSLFNILERRIANVPVYIVNDEQLAQVYGKSVPGLYSHTADAIFINDRQINTPYLFRVLTHEATHAAFIKAMYLNPDIHAATAHVANEFKEALTKAGKWKDFYAYQNVDEFIAEALSNITMQEALANTPASSELKGFMIENKMRAIGKPIRTLWDVLRKIISSALGLRDTQTVNSLLDAVLQITAELDFTLESNPSGALTQGQAIHHYNQKLASIADPFTPWTGEGGEAIFTSPFGSNDFKKVVNALPENVRPREGTRQTRVWALPLRSMDQIAQLAKDFGSKFAKHVRELANALQRMHTRRLAMFGKSEILLHDIYEAKREFAGPRWDAFTDFLHDETTTQVYGDRPLDQQEHLGKDRLASVWSKAQHTRLTAEWGALDPKLQNLRNKMLAYFKEQHEGMARELVDNIIHRLLGHEDPVLSKKLFKKEELTPEDNAKLGDDKAVFNHIRHARELGRIKGPYYPLMRIGEYVASGTYKFTPPSDGVLIKDTDNLFEFSGDNARERAKAYAEKQLNPTRVFSAWVDPETGEAYFKDVDEEGIEIELKAGPKEERSEQRFRVEVMNEYVEFFDSLKDAQAEDFERRKDTNYTPSNLGPRRFNQYESGSRGLMSREVRQVLDSLEKRPSYGKLTPTQKGELEKAFRELSLRMYGTTRIQARSLQRRRVLGASRDFDKVTLQYAQSMAGYRAKLQTDREIDAAMDAMQQSVNDTEDGGQKAWAARGAISNEMTRRTTKLNEQAPPSNWDTIVNRWTIASFVNYLMSPAYSVNNLLQVGMLAYPQLAAKYGSGTAARMLFKAYKDMGIGRVLKAGFKETKKATRPGVMIRHNFLEEAMKSIHDPGERAMLEYLRDNGSIVPEAGLEMDRLISGKRLDKMLDYTQNIARAMPSAIETINRVTVGLAAYRMNMKRTGNHDEATAYAQEMVNLTQGNYSAANMPSFFNHPIGRLAFQFKKYGQTVYGQIGHNIGKIIRNENPGDAKEAAKALALMGATHVMIAGALGLPTEPIRWLITGANLAGLTEANWEDVENWERQLATSIFGTKGGEIVSRGLPRLFGIDVSERVGMQSLLTQDAPRSGEEESIMAYVGELLSGAPGGMALDSINGINELFNGDVQMGIEKLAPLKIVSDALKSYRIATEGKETAAGYKIMDPIGMTGALLQTFGYRSAQEAEISERRSFVYSSQQRTDAARNDLQRRWAKATPNERTRMWGEIEAFNRSQSRGGRLTRTMLQDYAKRKRGEDVVDGFRVTRTNRDLINRTRDVYDVAD